MQYLRRFFTFILSLKQIMAYKVFKEDYLSCIKIKYANTSCKIA